MWHQPASYEKSWPPFCQIWIFSLTWSCGSRQRDTASSGWKFKLNNLAVKGLKKRDFAIYPAKQNIFSLIFSLVIVGHRLWCWPTIQVYLFICMQKNTDTLCNDTLICLFICPSSPRRIQFSRNIIHFIKGWPARKRLARSLDRSPLQIHKFICMYMCMLKYK